MLRLHCRRGNSRAKITEMTIKHYPLLTGQAHGLNTRDATRVPIQLMKLWQKLQRSRWQRWTYGAAGQ